MNLMVNTVSSFRRCSEIRLTSGETIHARHSMEKHLKNHLFSLVQGLKVTDLSGDKFCI